MDGRLADLEDVRYFLTLAPRGRAWMRAVFETESDAPRLAYADIVVGPRPPTWRGNRVWTYDKCVFVSKATTSGVINKALGHEDDQARPIPLGPVSSTMEVQDGTFMADHLPSLGQHDRHQYPWPTLEFDLNLPNLGLHQLPSDFLIGAGAPSFATAAAAFNAFFYGDFRVTGANAPSYGNVVIRIGDERGRISRVRSRPSALEVNVSGESVAGLRLELNSVEDRTTVTLDEPGRTSFPLPHGLSDDTWIWLKGGTDWIDYRSINSWSKYHSPNVEFEVPQDPESDLSALIAQGEGDFIEFKSKLPETKHEKRGSFKTVAAFAMGEGGTIIFGIEDETGALVGLPGPMAAASRRFTDLVNELVRPTPKYRAKSRRLDSKSLLVVEVLPSGGAIHSLTVDPNKPEYFVRRGATTFYARPEDIAAVTESKGGPNDLTTRSFLENL